MRCIEAYEPRLKGQAGVPEWSKGLGLGPNA